MRHLAIWAMLAGCEDRAEDTGAPVVEVVTARPVVGDHDCGQPANGGTPSVQIEIPPDVMFAAEFCGVAESGDEEIDLCQQPTTILRKGEHATIYCTARTPVAEETAFVRLWLFE